MHPFLQQNEVRRLSTSPPYNTLLCAGIFMEGNGNLIKKFRVTQNGHE